MEIKGRDVATESYRVVSRVDGRDVVALVPERLAENPKIIAARPSHQAAYVWIAANQERIEKAIAQLLRGGRRAKRPFDQITILEG